MNPTLIQTLIFNIQETVTFSKKPESNKNVLEEAQNRFLKHNRNSQKRLLRTREKRLKDHKNDKNSSTSP